MEGVWAWYMGHQGAMTSGPRTHGHTVPAKQTQATQVTCHTHTNTHSKLATWLIRNTEL